MTQDEETAEKLPPPGFVMATRKSPYTTLIGPFYEIPDDADGRRGFWVSGVHINNAGIIHGGMVMSFTDNLLARAVSNSGAGPAVTLHMTTDFVGPAHLGDWVEGKAKIIRRTRTLVFVEGEVFTRKRLMMTAKGVFRRLGRSHENSHENSHEGRG
ncbi:MAG: PaaI family thioesterase [Rhodospirillaceae bacterium]|jgi:uncharacterized protein (TIGR00369 family)|nr:PaaI family thioesterase [Rhodospirillaceae bacterium]MBT3492861.1 PaaI family thioesterase [Rhodospirillaceae bacterium]MBT3779960.1 PaaI family thioesterase [Rhodospirillaceae bacterium]MBT3976712.1 PaaI family thioesterase [Rhodospirillaceae bacterium]MBT4169473.1 PaaI family thioesterase [Rhodospirillaceae bacterium]